MKFLFLRDRGDDVAFLGNHLFGVVVGDLLGTVVGYLYGLTVGHI